MDFLRSQEDMMEEKQENKKVINNRFQSNKDGEFTCPFDGTKYKIEDLRNRISIKEAGISGLCQKCQDSVFWN